MIAKKKYEPLSELAWHFRYLSAALWALGGVVMLAATFVINALYGISAQIAEIVCATGVGYTTTTCSPIYQSPPSPASISYPFLIGLGLLIYAWYKADILDKTPIMEDDVVPP